MPIKVSQIKLMAGITKNSISFRNDIIQKTKTENRMSDILWSANTIYTLESYTDSSYQKQSLQFNRNNYIYLKMSYQNVNNIFTQDNTHYSGMIWNWENSLYISNDEFINPKSIYPLGQNKCRIQVSDIKECGEVVIGISINQFFLNNYTNITKPFSPLITLTINKHNQNQ